MTKETMQASLSDVKKYFDRSTSVLEETDSNFAPAEGMFTAAGQVAHVAQTIEWFFDGVFAPGGFSMEFEKMDAEARGVKSLTEARQWLDRAFASASALIAGKSDAEWAERLPPGPIMGGAPRYAVMSGIADHTAHHRGALTVYARLVGKVPPMPYM